jgi:UDP-N-acetylmuramoyl-tripeptide--D-alanyl-D-alanine ligase
LRWLAEAIGGRILTGDHGQRIENVVTDTRTLAAGDFFVALRGARFDGNLFVGDACERGAIGALVDASYTGPVWGAMVQVEDTTRGLQELAHAVRQASGTRVVAITGSAGKTTTKEAIAELLSPDLRVVRNKGNLNNHIGLPLSLLQLRTRPDVAVMELGMNHAGEIRRLVEIAEPDVRVWTNVGDAHRGFFASLDAIADAKAEILERSGTTDVLVCNADDERVMRRVAGFRGKTVTFGTTRTANVRASDIELRGVRGMRARITTPVGSVVVETPLLGRGNLANVLAATAVALEFEVPLDAIAAKAATLTPVARRGVVRRLANDIIVIDDSYNSSPAALGSALDVLAHDRSAARRVAALGEMLELGDSAVALHEDCARTAVDAGVGLLVAVGGPPARAMADAAIAAGLEAWQVIYCETSRDAAEVVAAALRPGDLVLVKGSRGVGMDVVVDRILAERS